jgi:phage virion morphogenesis protein
MAGASMDFSFDDSEALAMFARLRERGRSPRPVLNEIGSVLEQSARDRFKSERGPDGIPLAPISEEWRKEKARRGFASGILKMRGDLLNSVRANSATDEGVEVVATINYAAIHQFGGEIRPRRKKALKVRDRLLSKVTIPARPFLGISTEDRGEILDAVRDFLARASA